MILNLPSKPIDRYTVTVYRVELSNTIPSLRTNRYIYYEHMPWNDHPWGQSWGQSRPGSAAPFTDDWTVEIKWNVDDPEFCGEGRISGWAGLARYLNSDTSVFVTRREAEQFMIQALETRIQRRQEEIKELKTKLNEIQGGDL